jgi:hypothetical protein
VQRGEFVPARAVQLMIRAHTPQRNSRADTAMSDLRSALRMGPWKSLHNRAIPTSAERLTAD